MQKTTNSECIWMVHWHYLAIDYCQLVQRQILDLPLEVLQFAKDLLLSLYEDGATDGLNVGAYADEIEKMAVFYVSESLRRRSRLDNFN